MDMRKIIKVLISLLEEQEDVTIQYELKPKEEKTA